MRGLAPAAQRFHGFASSYLFPTISAALTLTCRARCKRGLKVVPSLLRKLVGASSRFSPFSIRPMVAVNGGELPTTWIVIRTRSSGRPALFVIPTYRSDVSRPTAAASAPLVALAPASGAFAVVHAGQQQAAKTRPATARRERRSNDVMAALQ